MFCRPPKQVKSTDAADEEGASQQTTRRHMLQGDQEVRVRDQGRDVGQDQLPIVDLVAYRLLHKAIGDQDKDRREVDAERHDPDEGKMHLLRYDIPAREPETKEG